MFLIKEIIKAIIAIITLNGFIGGKNYENTNLQNEIHDEQKDKKDLEMSIIDKKEEIAKNIITNHEVVNKVVDKKNDLLVNFYLVLLRNFLYKMLAWKRKIKKNNFSRKKKKYFKKKLWINKEWKTKEKDDKQ
ncbi:hypothetical protein [Mycoplasma parvum]|uniref:Uncharacterized protein n=1 Tax=Mycoplasma parvum str. Indiana TaxID=1403316 RepID=U5NBM8_9MOLU|nr:hypothetical protein [Mycoplasma parvum]AGX88822.1 hypothetical protein PRV_00185 [Mycoplasma parvum str. Indiana]